MGIRFRNRTDAGDKLADRLRSARPPGEQHEPPVVLGLPRGGVPVAARVAEALHAPLDVLVIRKVGVPWQAELALGAVGEGGAKVLNRAIIASTGLSEDEVTALAAKAAEEVGRRVEHFVVDTQTDPPTSVAVIRRAINERPFAIMGTVYSSSTVANMEIARQAGIPQISGSESVLVVTKGNPNIFLTSFSQQVGFAKLVKWLVEDPRPRRSLSSTSTTPSARAGGRCSSDSSRIGANPSWRISRPSSSRPTSPPS